MVYLWQFLSALLGLVVQAFVKMNGINDRTDPSVSVSVIAKQYFRRDFFKIGISFFCIFIEIMVVHMFTILEGQLVIPFVNWDLYNWRIVIVTGWPIILPFISFFSSTIVFLGKTATEKFFHEKSGIDIKD